ncbi:MAG: DoxX family protein [Prevotella sp.]|nr:DoxX family protein [Prevotella sp.]
MITNQYIIRVFTFILGVFFIVSGLSKGVDFFGTSLKIEEFFYVLNIDVMLVLPDTIAFVLIGGELFLGSCFIIGTHIRFYLLVTIIMLLFFCFIMAHLLINNSIIECGCFGGLFEMNILRSFIKNIVLIIICILAFFFCNNSSSSNSNFEKVLFIIWIIAFCVINIMNQPLYDYRYSTSKLELETLEFESFCRTHTLSYTEIQEQSLEDTIVIGVIRNIRMDSYSKEMIKGFMCFDRTRRFDYLLTTSSKSPNWISSADCRLYKSDSQSLQNCMAANIGIYVIYGKNVIGKWQQNSLGLQDMPQKLNDIKFNRVRIVPMLFWIFSYIVIILFVKTHKPKCGK